MFVGAGQRAAAVFQGGQVDAAIDIRKVGPDLTVDAQPRDTAVRVDVQPQVRPCLIAVDA